MTVNSLNSVNSATSLNLSEHVQGQDNPESNGGHDGGPKPGGPVPSGASGTKGKQQDTKEILKGYRERAICIVSG